MNIQEYISSGIVESYVLGLTEQEERVEFERMCAAHAEVRKAKEQFELSLEAQAMSEAVQPSKNIRSKIFAEIEIQNDKLDKASFPGDANSTYTDLNKGIEPRGIVTTMKWQRFLAAASIVLLVISTALNFYLFNQYKTYSSRYANLVDQQTELAKSNEVMRTKLDSYESAVALLRNPDMSVIKMPATNVPTSPDSNSVATVYWNTKSKDVYLLVNNLPLPPSDRQYQLWAIVDGKPVDAGVFDLETVPGLLRMKNMPRAEVFAVTLEKRGGSSAPEGPMYVLGKVS